MPGDIMDFSENNRLYELAAKNENLQHNLEALYQSYVKKMHSYLLALAGQYGITLEEECFFKKEDTDENIRNNQRLKLIGLILNKKPEEKEKFVSFSRELDQSYALEKMAIAKEAGVNLNFEEAMALSMWTGVL